MDSSIIYTLPTIHDLPDDRLPDPEGYYVGQEDFGFDDEDEASDNDYDDAYEPDISYDAY
jgi:hypothetical protein